MTKSIDKQTQWTTKKIRRAFLDYFKSNGHTAVPSSTLVPHNDPTLLFTNAGMVPFKDVFLGQEKRPYKRATSSQRCVRAGGKHNDLENVGYTKRHHTFFEMLGNFSFGDYSKKQAIHYAWRFLTEILKIPTERLWVTVYREDKETETIWLKEMGIDPKRFSRCGEKDNFWSMGDVGPCGPCTEIFYDHGETIAGGPPGSPDEDGDRYTEIWNLVFMQFERDADGKLKPLPSLCVDTGIGLERLAAVMQGVHDNYDIDLFKSLLEALGKIVNHHDYKATPMRVIVDHIRSASFLITDGVTPSNEGRGYVLRRIIRRAARYGFKLGQQNPFFYKLVPALVAEMGGTYPELKQSEKHITQLIEQEEKQFSNTLANGLKILEKLLAESKKNEIDGQLMFQLYDTYGFPTDLTIDIAKEKGMSWDYAGFKAAMLKQREQSQQFAQFHADQTKQLHISGETVFTGYETASDEGEVIALLSDYKPIHTLHKGEQGIVVLNKTPFYAESGGQVGDSGYLYFKEGSFRVQNTLKKGAVYLHFGSVVEGDLSIGDAVQTQVDATRDSVKLNHSATHLLHEALRRVLGEHVMQKGSLVEAKRLRFDFSHSQALTFEQMRSIERLVNQQIRANIPTQTRLLSLQDAKEAGATALFSEKYDDEVRVVRMGEFSMEICGGTHVARTGDIGLFKISSESACAAGIRRIEAVTGDEALAWVESTERKLETAAELLKTNRDQINDKIDQLVTQNKQLTKELSHTKQIAAAQGIDNLLTDSVVTINNQLPLLISSLGEMDRETLRNMIDAIKQRLDKPVIVLAAINDGKVVLMVSVHKEWFKYFKAPDLLKHIASIVGGKGGGRPDLAQGGGDNPEALSDALASVTAWIKKHI